MSAVLFSDNIIVEFPTVAYQIPKLADVCRRNKAAAYKVVLENIRNPFGIFLVGLFTSNGFHIFWMCKNNFDMLPI